MTAHNDSVVQTDSQPGSHTTHLHRTPEPVQPCAPTSPKESSGRVQNKKISLYKLSRFEFVGFPFLVVSGQSASAGAACDAWLGQGTGLGRLWRVAGSGDGLGRLTSNQASIFMEMSLLPPVLIVLQKPRPSHLCATLFVFPGWRVPSYSGRQWVAIKGRNHASSCRPVTGYGPWLGVLRFGIVEIVAIRWYGICL